MSTLLIRLDGPLQAWGSDSKYDDRKTDYYPTKSGVIGMIASALGRNRDADLSDLQRLKFGVRVDNAGKILTDLQVTNMGDKFNSNLSRRQYLSDAVFVVGLESDDYEFLNEIRSALQHPAYPLFLGRRSCPPTFPLFIGIRDEELYDSLQKEDWQLSLWRRKNHYGSLPIYIETKESGKLVRDVPISFSPFNRQYTYRYINEMPSKQVEEGTRHDAMKEL